MTDSINIGGHDYGREDLAIAVIGPQGSGKTQLALRLDELLTADGRNTYVVDEGEVVSDGGYGLPIVTGTTRRPIDLADLCVEIHASNVTAGWWTDLKTGESTLATRNRPEMLMLGVSELAEAAEGIDLRPDDKLPHLCMFDVELADFVIRQLDQIGAEVSLGARMPIFESVCSSPFRAKSWTEQLMLLVGIVAVAMEHYRKGRVDDYVQVMADGVDHAFAVADANGIDLLDIIAQKRAFNATRADHKVENRVKDGGKAF